MLTPTLMSEKQNLLKQVDIIARLAVQCVSTHFLSQKPNSFGGFQNPQIILTPIGFKPMSEKQNLLKQVGEIAHQRASVFQHTFCLSHRIHSVVPNQPLQ
jgi:hypothetical protein